MPLVNAALAGTLVAATNTFSIADIPVRSVNVCSDKAEILRQGEFNIGGPDAVFVFQGAANAVDMRIEFFMPDGGNKSASASAGEKLVPVEVGPMGPGAYRIKVEAHQNQQLIGRFRYRSHEVIATTVTYINLEDESDRAELQTVAQISQTTGSAWKNVSLDYRRNCNQEDTHAHSGGASTDGAVKVMPVFVTAQPEHPVIEAFRQNGLDVGGAGEPVKVVLDQQSVAVEWEEGIVTAEASKRFRYVALPVDRMYGEKIIIHQSGKRSFEAHGQLKAGRLVFPIGWVR